jgi:hypothetical protein
MAELAWRGVILVTTPIEPGEQDMSGCTEQSAVGRGREYHYVQWRVYAMSQSSDDALGQQRDNLADSLACWCTSLYDASQVYIAVLVLAWARPTSREAIPQ